MWPFDHGKHEQDWSGYPKDAERSRKQRLISECMRRDVSIHVDESDESSEGVYAILRAVASEAELERRLRVARAESMASRANLVAWLALAVSIIGVLASLLSDA